jgi:hypothetical protein
MPTASGSGSSEVAAPWLRFAHCAAGRFVGALRCCSSSSADCSGAVGALRCRMAKSDALTNYKAKHKAKRNFAIAPEAVKGGEEGGEEGREEGRMSASSWCRSAGRRAAFSYLSLRVPAQRGNGSRAGRPAAAWIVPAGFERGDGCSSTTFLARPAGLVRWTGETPAPVPSSSSMTRSSCACSGCELPSSTTSGGFTRSPKSTITSHCHDCKANLFSRVRVRLCGCYLKPTCRSAMFTNCTSAGPIVFSKSAGFAR